MTEFLLYIESFASNLATGKASANLRIRWTGLENRQLGYHKALFPIDRRISHQQVVEAQLHVSDTTAMRKTLLKDLLAITRPLFEAFDFFSVEEGEAEEIIRGVFNVSKDGGI